MFGGVKKEEYEEVVQGNSELRARMEKLRIENAMLKDQIRALKSLKKDESSIYIILQEKNSLSMDQLLQESELKPLGAETIKKGVSELIRKSMAEKRDVDGVEMYSIASPGYTGVMSIQNQEIQKLEK
jgi:hypothetical protein